MRESPAPSSRILAFQLHDGRSGQCVLDGFGLVPHGWQTTRVATCTADTLTRFIRRSVKRFRPAAVVVGVSRRRAAPDTALRRTALTALRPLGVPVVVRHVREAYQLFRDRIRGRRREELAHTIAVNFLPHLCQDFTPERILDRRTAWQALALALVELVHRFPRAAAALAQARAFSMQPFRTALQKAEAIRYPDPV